MLHTPGHSLPSVSAVSAIAYGSGQLHPPVSPSPSQSQSSDIPHSALRNPHSNDPQSEIRNPKSSYSPPPPAPFRLPANLSNIDLVCETIFASEAANHAWMMDHLQSNQPSQYNIPWINQATQSLCRTMALRKTLFALDEKLNPKPTAPATPALVSIDRRALDELKRAEAKRPQYIELDADIFDHDFDDDDDDDDDDDAPSAAAAAQSDPFAEPSPLPPTNPGLPLTGSADALVRNTPPPTESSPLPPTNPGPSLGARTSSSATAPAHQSVSAPADFPDSTSAPDTALSGCAAIRAVPLCPTYHRLIPNTPDSPNSPDAASSASTSESQSSPTLDVGHLTLDNPQSSPTLDVGHLTLDNPQSEIHIPQSSPAPSIPAPPYRPPWFRPPFPVKPTTPNTPNTPTTPNSS